MTFTQLTTRLQNFLRGWLLVLKNVGRCALKRKVILTLILVEGAQKVCLFITQHNMDTWTLKLFLTSCWVRSINHQSKLKCGCNLLATPFSFFQRRLFATGHFSQLPTGRIKWQFTIAKFLIHSHKKCNHLSHSTLIHVFFLLYEQL